MRFREVYGFQLSCVWQGKEFGTNRGGEGNWNLQFLPASRGRVSLGACPYFRGTGGGYSRVKVGGTTRFVGYLTGDQTQMGFKWVNGAIYLHPVIENTQQINLEPKKQEEPLWVPLFV